MAKIKLQVDADMGSAPGDFDKLNEKLAKMGINISGISGKAAGTKKELAGWDGLLKNFGFDVAKIATGFGLAELAIDGAKKAIGLLVAEYKEVLRIQDEMAKKARTYNETVVMAVGNNAALQRKIEAAADASKTSREQMMNLFWTAKKANPTASDAEAQNIAEMGVQVRKYVGPANVEPLVNSAFMLREAYPGMTSKEAMDKALTAFEETGRNAEPLNEVGKAVHQFKEVGVGSDKAIALAIEMSKSEQGQGGGVGLAGWIDANKHYTAPKRQFSLDAEGNPTVLSALSPEDIEKRKLAAMSGDEQINYAMNNLDNPNLKLPVASQTMLRDLKQEIEKVKRGAGAYDRLIASPTSSAQDQAEAMRQSDVSKESPLFGNLEEKEKGLMREILKSGIENLPMPKLKKDMINTVATLTTPAAIISGIESMAKRTAAPTLKQPSYGYSPAMGVITPTLVPEMSIGANPDYNPEMAKYLFEMLNQLKLIAASIDKQREEHKIARGSGSASNDLSFLQSKYVHSAMYD
jgi:hypothetical protein